MYFLTQLTQSDFDFDFASIQPGEIENPVETIWDWRDFEKIISGRGGSINGLVFCH